jgi:CRP/FNR family transcriptional regulator, cyclic AMP receptor protein
MTDSGPSIADVLKGTALFSALSDAELESLAARTLIRAYASGELLFSEGALCVGLYIVSKGRVRIFKTSPSGREQVLALEGPGSSIAELPVFDGGPYPASVAVVEPSELLFIARKDFRALCMECPEIALKVLQVAGARLRRLVGIIEELSFTTVRHRLISWILRQAKNEDECSFTLHASHQELAAQIGTVRELVSRNLARLQAQEFIGVNGHKVTILNLEGLEAELSSAI